MAIQKEQTFAGRLARALRVPNERNIREQLCNELSITEQTLRVWEFGETCPAPYIQFKVAQFFRHRSMGFD